MPDAHLDKLNVALTKGPGRLHYARVYMKLSEILDGDFFNTYVKNGMLHLDSNDWTNTDLMER